MPVAVMLPNYMQGWGLGRHFTGRASAFHLRLRGGRWALDVDGLNRAVTRQTRVILVCNPNNPTGAVFNEDEMQAIVAAARRSGAWILADEIYRGAELAGQAPTPTFWGRYERVAVTGGLSKAFGLPGLRIGWVVGPPALIQKVWVRHDYTTLTPGMLSDRLGAAALEPSRRDAILARTRDIVRRQWPRLEGWLRQHEEHLRVGAPCRRRHRPRSLPSPPRLGCPRGPGASRAVRAARARRHDGRRTQSSFRLRLRHRAHARGARPGRQDPRGPRGQEADRRRSR